MIDDYEVSGKTASEISCELRHEMRTPLNIILGYAELLGEKAKSEGDQGSLTDLDKIRAAAQELTRLVDRVGVSPTRVGHPQLSAEDLAHGHMFEGTLPKIDRTAETGKVLIIEDQADNREVLGRLLSASGHSIELASTGSIGFSKLEECTESGTRVDLILLDMRMPGMSGWEVLSKVRNDNRFCGVPVIVISGVDDTETIARCIEMGADDYVTKPFVPSILRARVNACLVRVRCHQREADLIQRLETSYRELREYLASEESA